MHACVLEHSVWLGELENFTWEKMTVDQIISNLECCLSMDVSGTHGVLEGND